MRRTLIALLLVAGVLLLAGCGNKGPLVRPSQAVAPTAAASTHTPAAPPPISTQPVAPPQQVKPLPPPTGG